jgi:hypothetical protein
VPLSVLFKPEAQTCRCFPGGTSQAQSFGKSRMSLILARKLRTSWNQEMRRHGMSRRRAHRWEPFRNTGVARGTPRRRIEYAEDMIELVGGSPYRTGRRLGANTLTVYKWAAEHREFALALVPRAASQVGIREWPNGTIYIACRGRKLQLRKLPSLQGFGSRWFEGTFLIC